MNPDYDWKVPSNPMKLKFFLGLLSWFILTCLLLADPQREKGLSVHMLPERVAQLSKKHGGFTVRDPSSPTANATYPSATELMTYFKGTPTSVQTNGIWVVYTHPDAYEADEKGSWTS